MRPAEALAVARARLGNGTDARLDATRLLQAASRRDAAWLLAHGEEPLAPAVGARFVELLARRAAGEPLAYVLGEAWFCGRRFAVNCDVLVPRPETEELAERALEFLQNLDRTAPALYDAGTGCGALAVTLCCEIPQLRALAVDCSPSALAVARANARSHGVGGRIDFVETGRLLADEGNVRFACIVANLPYVRTGELAAPPDPASFEPRCALDGGPDGLAVYRRLIADAPRALAAGGALFAEAGPDTVEALAALAEAAWRGAARVRIVRDYGGRQRIVEVRT